MEDIDIKQEIRSPKFRWLVTILALANAGYLISAYFDTQAPEMHFPVHLKGTVVLVVMSITLALFAAATAVTWFNRPRSGAV